jgi:hypothetical protein
MSPGTDGPAAHGADDRGHRIGGPTVQWIVWRQDDNGNQFEVARRQSRAEAEELAATMEARSHKQTYWVAALAE